MIERLVSSEFINLDLQSLGLLTIGFIQACKCKFHSCEEGLETKISNIPRKENVRGIEIVFESTLESKHDPNHRFQMNKDKNGVIFSGGKVDGQIEDCPIRQSGKYFKPKNTY